MRLLLILLLSYVSFSQSVDSLTPGTNPLANTLPPPVEKPIHNNYQQTSTKVQSTEVELSQNVKDYLHEKENPNPLKSFEDNKIKFNDYDKTPITVEENDETDSTSKSIIIGFVLFIIIGAFGTFLFINRKN